MQGKNAPGDDVLVRFLSDSLRLVEGVIRKGSHSELGSYPIAAKVPIILIEIYSTQF